MRVDLQRNAPRLRQHINEPLVQAALKAGMDVWARNFSFRREPYDPKKGPWWYSGNDYWCDQKPPKKNSLEWFRCTMACHWLRGFACALGQAAFPRRDWFIVGGEKHSTAVGVSRSGTVHVLDPLLSTFLTANEILEHAGWPNNCEIFNVHEEIEWRLCEYKEWLACREFLATWWSTHGEKRVKPEQLMPMALKAESLNLSSGNARAQRIRFRGLLADLQNRRMDVELPKRGKVWLRVSPGKESRETLWSLALAT
jgi:hypothetical protein